MPLWRDLGRGSHGRDVEALQSELARLGHEVAVDGTYGKDTAAAVRDLLSGAGADRPDGNLAVDSVLWIPFDRVVMGSCDAAVGDHLDGGQVAVVAGRLTSLEVVDPPGEGWALTYGGHTAPVDAQGTVIDAKLLAAVEAGPLLAAAEPSGEPGAEGPAAQLTMTIELATPVDVVVLPPAAVVPDGAGRGCVDADGARRPVEIVSSSLGQALVCFTDGRAAPEQVDVRPDRDAGCR